MRTKTQVFLKITGAGYRESHGPRCDITEGGIINGGRNARDNLILEMARYNTPHPLFIALTTLM